MQPPFEGCTAGEHLVRHGRVPPLAVLEIASQMAVALVHLEQAGLPHGDVSAATLCLTAQGRALLSAPGVRPIIRPAEGFAHAELAPGDYDTLAPERIDAGATPDPRTDLYACGCLWWHLLAGRAPFPGGMPGKLTPTCLPHRRRFAAWPPTLPDSRRGDRVVSPADRRASGVG